MTNLQKAIQALKYCRGWGIVNVRVNDSFISINHLIADLEDELGAV